MTQKSLYLAVVADLPALIETHFISGGVVAVGMLFDDIESALTSSLNVEKLQLAIQTVRSERAYKQRLKHIALQTGHANSRALKSHIKSQVAELQPLLQFVIERVQDTIPKAYRSLGLLGVLQVLAVLDPANPPHNIRSVAAHTQHMVAELQALLT